jgi:hypothetical protein
MASSQIKKREKTSFTVSLNKRMSITEMLPLQGSFGRPAKSIQPVSCEIKRACLLF